MSPSRKKPAPWHQFPYFAEWSGGGGGRNLKNNNEAMTIKLAYNESHKYIITMSHLVQNIPELPKTAHSDSSCPYAGPGLCSCISMSLSGLPGMVSLVTGFWLRGTLITPRNEFPLGGRLGECKSREFRGRGRVQRGKGVTKDLEGVPRFPFLRWRKETCKFGALRTLKTRAGVEISHPLLTHVCSSSGERDWLSRDGILVPPLLIHQATLNKSGKIMGVRTKRFSRA